MSFIGFDVIPCATEADWHAERAKAIGASEAAAIIGQHKYLTPLELWSRKKNNLPDTTAEKEWIQAGHFLEDGNARWHAHVKGREIVTPQQYYGCPDAYAVIVRHPKYPLQATLDRVIVPDLKEHQASGVLQLKNVTEWLDDEWSGDEAPLAVQIQVQIEMLCSGLRWGSIGAIVGGNKRRDTDVAAHPEFQEKLGRMAERFWASLSTDVAPQASAGDLETIKRQYPNSLPGCSKELERPELLMDYARVQAEIKQLEKQADALKAALELEMGPAELATIQGRKAATWKTTEANYQAQPARTVSMRKFLVSSDITKAAKAAIERHEQLSLPD